MQIAVYARVSTNRQNQTQTIEQQISRLETAVEYQPDWQLLPEHGFRDDDYIGSTLNRPGLDRLRDGAALAKYGLVLVTGHPHPSRFGKAGCMTFTNASPTMHG